MKYIITIITIIISLLHIVLLENMHCALLLLHISMITISSIMIFSDAKRPFTCHKTTNIFFLFFIGIAPYIQFITDVHMWNSSFDEYDYLISSIVFLFIIILYNILYYFFKYLKIENKTISYLFENRERKRVSIFLLSKIVILLTIILFIILNYYNYNYNSFIYRVTDNDTSYSTQSLITTFFFRPLGIFIFMLALIYYKKNIFFLTICGLLSVIILFPTGIPRFLVAATYMPIMVMMFPIFKKKYVFSILIIIALLFCWPAINIFRNINNQYSMMSSLELFKSGNMDSYSSMTNILKYDIITYGKQLLGVLFFFVPRSIWTDKPVSSGLQISNDLSLSFGNISCNYFAEGYLNFGIIGVILFVVFFALCTASVDYTFWKKNNFNNGSYAYYLVLVCYTIFFLRGALMDAYAYLMSITIAIVLANKIITTK